MNNHASIDEVILYSHFINACIKMAKQKKAWK